MVTGGPPKPATSRFDSDGSCGLVREVGAVSCKHAHEGATPSRSTKVAGSAPRRSTSSVRKRDAFDSRSQLSRSSACLMFAIHLSVVADSTHGSTKPVVSVRLRAERPYPNTFLPVHADRGTSLRSSLAVFDSRRGGCGEGGHSSQPRLITLATQVQRCLRYHRGNAQSEAPLIRAQRRCDSACRDRANVDQLAGVAPFRPENVWVQIPPLAPVRKRTRWGIVQWEDCSL